MKSIHLWVENIVNFSRKNAFQSYSVSVTIQDSHRHWLILFEHTTASAIMHTTTNFCFYFWIIRTFHRRTTTPNNT